MAKIPFQNNHQAFMEKITIFSDYICPFCYIGKDRAEKLEKDFKIEIEWKMIEIHPETPKKGIETKSISSPYLNSVWKEVQSIADESNIDMKIPIMIPY